MRKGNFFYLIIIIPVVIFLLSSSPELKDNLGCYCLNCARDVVSDADKAFCKRICWSYFKDYVQEFISKSENSAWFFPVAREPSKEDLVRFKDYHREFVVADILYYWLATPRDFSNEYGFSKLWKEKEKEAGELLSCKYDYFSLIKTGRIASFRDKGENPFDCYIKSAAVYERFGEWYLCILTNKNNENNCKYIFNDYSNQYFLVELESVKHSSSYSSGTGGLLTPGVNYPIITNPAQQYSYNQQMNSILQNRGGGGSWRDSVVPVITDYIDGSFKEINTFPLEKPFSECTSSIYPFNINGFKDIILKDPNPRMREGALKIISTFGSFEVKILWLINEALKDSDEQVRETARSIKDDKINEIKRFDQNDLTGVLYGAVKSGDKESIELLVDFGADLNKCSFVGTRCYEECYITPLKYAVEACNKELSSLLLDKGADVKEACIKKNRDYCCSSSINVIAINKCDSDLLRLLADHGSLSGESSSLLRVAAEKGDKKMVEILLANGLNPSYLSNSCFFNYKDKDIQKLLKDACKKAKENRDLKK